MDVYIFRSFSQIDPLSMKVTNNIRFPQLKILALSTALHSNTHFSKLKI
jgi:hypothetical protein